MVTKDRSTFGESFQVGSLLIEVRHAIILSLSARSATATFLLLPQLGEP